MNNVANPIRTMKMIMANFLKVMANFFNVSDIGNLSAHPVKSASKGDHGTSSHSHKV